MKHPKLRLNCICESPHYIEIILDKEDKDWPCYINMCGVHRGFWKKIKDFFKTDWFVDEIIISEEQIKSLYTFIKMNKLPEWMNKSDEEPLFKVTQVK